MKRMTAVAAAALILAGAAPATAEPVDPPGMLTFGGLQRTYLVHAGSGAPGGTPS